ncbi:MAG: serine protease [Gemmatimonadetes bacterium]|nr:serine protease [Gemmatimonadota bacterium]
MFEDIRLATVGFGLFWPPPDKREPVIVGTGIAIKRPRVILTAAHVLEGLRKEAKTEKGTAAVFTVDSATSSRQEVELSYAVTAITQSLENQQYDVAVVSIERGGFPSRQMAVGYDLAPQEGDQVVTCGWPHGIKLYKGKTVISTFLQGPVSAVIPHPVAAAALRDSYTIQMPVNPGNSGGGVIEVASGKVFGIVMGVYGTTGLATVSPLARCRDMIENAGLDSQGGKR